jgi:transposase InsO family protein
MCLSGLRQALPPNNARVVVKFLKKLFSHFESPRVLISDKGTHFCNNQLENVLKRLGVTHKFAIPYHSQMMNRELKRILKMVVNHTHKDWSIKLDDTF